MSKHYLWYQEGGFILILIFLLLDKKSRETEEGFSELDFKPFAQGIKVTENSLTCGFRMKEKKKQITKGVDEMITMKITEMNPTYEEWESYFIFKSKKTDNVIFDEGYTQEKDGTTTFRQGFTVNASEKDYLNFLRWLKQQRKGKKGKK